MKNRSKEKRSKEKNSDVKSFVCPVCGPVTEYDEIVTVFGGGSRATYCCCGAPSAYWRPVASGPGTSEKKEA